tara:strand:+ start:1870 stop:2160 length:291 start_codon:yes stop_codon:yes gene_type:complete
MEVLITDDLKVCIQCNKARNKKHLFNKRSKICNNCKYKVKNNNIEYQVNCLYCLWSGKDKNYINHECVTDLNKNKIKFKKVDKIQQKENPFLITFN